MAKFNVPTRKYTQKERQKISWRLPADLIESLEREARKRGWTTTEFVISGLDQFVQWSEKKTPK